MNYVVTVITGNYDDLKPINSKNPDWEYIAFVNIYVEDSEGWDIRHTDDLKPPKRLNNQQLQRWAKTVGILKYFQTDDRILYIDGKLQIVYDVTGLIEDSDSFVISGHEKRFCVYEEAKACKLLNKAPIKDIDRQINYYKNIGFPSDIGMVDTSLMFRIVGKESIQFGQLWWEEMNKYTFRDQLSVTKIAWQLGQSIDTIPYETCHRYCKLTEHKTKRNQSNVCLNINDSDYREVYYINSYDPDINIGRGYNRHIQHLPDDCIVVIMDMDTNTLLPDFGDQVQYIAQNSIPEYALIGAVVNRVGGLHQTYQNRFSDDHEMRNHYRIAQELSENHWGEVEPTSGVAGCFMMFEKSTWKKVGGFRQGTNRADTYFNQDIKQKNLGKIGLAKGLYLYHCYRIWQTDHKKAWRDSKHLVPKHTKRIK